MSKVEATASFLTEQGIKAPQIGIILGTGLTAMVDEMEIQVALNYEAIPNFPVSTVEFHKGKLLFGKLEGKTVLAMQGRFHYYEGHSAEETVFPVRVMSKLGIKELMISNAGGNMNLSWKKGELMLINDHINLQPDSPLRGKEATGFGPIFVDMSEPYSKAGNAKLRQLAKDMGIRLNEGTYVCVPGPNLETKAEYRYLRRVGADVVGMSTVPEVIAANQLNLPVIAISVLTDDCDPDNLAPINIQNILATAQLAEKDLTRLFRAYIKS